MATVFVRKMPVSSLNPLLHQSQCPVNPPRLSTLLLGPLCAGGPVGAKPNVMVAAVPLLLPSHLLLSLQFILEFKTKGVIKEHCRDCYWVKRCGHWFIYCKTNPKHKQRQM
ncbi:LOW QUALITY PROTEIN: 39S ribosomal protein L36, mitochondrial [Mirounga leonina]|uniref:LOW QUALITY PROTEIN: 39S ribosomal protein L36, mitochondrial n=1 Tax=Mirounga leonina TaxID=9715 RepID=UPI00156C34E3|nr:LOW QUALITY PROTEIN: 39S ribosomal protein L36, mitochondrial [Mirounga leonina]